MEAEPTGVLLQWEHPGGDDVMFLIMWSRDATFHPVDETKAELIDATRGVFQFREPLPTSGTSQYRVRAFRVDGTEASEPSNAVTVSINGPAAGDV